MVIRKVETTPMFKNAFKKIKDNSLREKVKNKVVKITERHEVGKPLRYSFKGECVVRITPFRLGYCVRGDVLFLLWLEHIDRAYHK